MKIVILKSEYKLSHGPNGNLYISMKRKPHICYSLEAAKQIGIIQINA